MNPTERILNALTESGNEPKRNGSGWHACCPAHEDRSPSLSINEGDDGLALVKCFAGCTVEAVCAAVGMKVADLMPTADTLPRPTGGNRPRKSSSAKPKGQSSSTSKDDKSYATAAEAVAALERGLGKRSHLWTYHDADGEPVGVIVRWNQSDRKTIRQASRRSDGRWITKAMPNPRPLYRLPELTVVEDDTALPAVYVVEGEKAADALTTLGLTVTTSAGGSSAPKQSDWTPLAGRDVVLLPDNDKAGTKYRNDVLDLLSALQPQPTVRVVELPGLPEKGDAFDWIAAGADCPGENLREELEKLAEATEAEALPTPDEPLRWQPPPVEILPKLLADFVHAAAKSRVVDPAMVVMPLLVALAGAIGGTRRVLIKPDWGEPCIIWGALVAPSGSGKTPAATPVLQAVRDRDATAVLTNERLLSDHQDDLKQHEVNRKKAKESEPLREKPERPPLVRFHLQDVTPEQLMAVLADNPRGVLLVRDELSALFGGFGRYSDGKGAAERGKYLSIWSAEHLSDDRKVAQSVYVRRPHVSIYGGIQPAMLFRSLGNDDLAAGLPARFLFVWPPERSRRWSDTSVSQRLTDGVARVFDRLFGLAMAEKTTTDAHGFEHKGIPCDRRAVHRRSSADNSTVDRHGSCPDAGRRRWASASRLCQTTPATSVGWHWCCNSPAGQPVKGLAMNR